MVPVGLPLNARYTNPYAIKKAKQYPHKISASTIMDIKAMRFFTIGKK
jgi:hypothetical protein